MKILKKIMLSILITGSASSVAFGMKGNSDWLLQEIKHSKPVVVFWHFNVGEHSELTLTALMKAAIWGDIDRVAELIRSVPVEQRAEYINYKNSSGRSAIDYAIEKRQIVVLDVLYKYLSACNAEQAVQARFDSVPLIEAVKRGDVEKVVQLILSVPMEQRIEFIMFVDSKGNTAFDYAFNNGDTAVCDVLDKYLLVARQ